MGHEVGKGSNGCIMSISHFYGVFKALIVLNRYGLIMKLWGVYLKILLKIEEIMSEVGTDSEM